MDGDLKRVKATVEGHRRCRQYAIWMLDIMGYIYIFWGNLWGRTASVGEMGMGLSHLPSFLLMILLRAVGDVGSQAFPISEAVLITKFEAHVPLVPPQRCIREQLCFSLGKTCRSLFWHGSSGQRSAQRFFEGHMMGMQRHIHSISLWLGLHCTPYCGLMGLPAHYLSF